MDSVSHPVEAKDRAEEGRENTAFENIALLSLLHRGAEQDEKLTLYVQWENQKVGQVHIS